MASAKELAFQNDMIQQLVANGWLLGKPEGYRLSYLKLVLTNTKYNIEILKRRENVTQQH